MNNLESLNVRELDKQELEEVYGGFPFFWVGLAIGLIAGFFGASQ